MYQNTENRGVHLWFEVLEDRITPTTFNATDAADLQSDFAYANSNPTQQVIINLSSGSYNLSAIGSQLTDQNTAGITLNGNGATLTATTNNRIFEVDEGGKLALNNLTLTGGNLTAATAQGGAIADFGGGVTLSSNVNVTGNAVHGSTSAQGGGIYMLGGASLSIGTNCIIDSNRAIGSTSSGGAADAYGGGIYVNGGSVTISGSTISGNNAQGGVNAHGPAYGAYGGGLCLDGGTVNLIGSTLSNNKVLGCNAADNMTTLTGYAGGYAQGGGLYMLGNSSGVTILYSSFSGNTAQGGNGGDGLINGGTAGAAEGGAFADVSNNSVSIQQSSFDSNRVTGGSGGGGGVGGSITVSGTGTFDGMTGGTGGLGGTASGGGLFVLSQSVVILNSSITNNTATGSDGGSGGTGGPGSSMGVGGNGGNGGTGGTGDSSGLLLADGGSSTVINTTVGGNTAQGGVGGAGGAGGSGGSGDGSNGLAGSGGTALGGGLEISGASLINDTVAFNSALAGSGGGTAATGKGGGIEASGTTLTNVIVEGNTSSTDAPDMDGSLGSASSCDFISNTSGISGTIPATGMILNDSTSQLGGLTVDPIFGLSYYPLLSGSAVIGAGTTSEVDTIAGAEDIPDAYATDEIGFFFVTNNAVNMGAIAAPNAENKALEVKISTDKGNPEAEDTLSWAIKHANTDPLVSTIDFAIGNPTVALQKELPKIQKNVTITGNPTIIQGNASAQNPYRIFTINLGVTATISNLTIEGGYAAAAGNNIGGGILNDGNLTLNNDYVEDNTATGSGGGIYNGVGSQLTLNGVTIVGNRAQGSGGGLANINGTVSSNSGQLIINGNTAIGDGGGIYMTGDQQNPGKITCLDYTEINGNSAGGAGGGVNIGGKAIFSMVDGGTISNNYNTGNLGGGLYVGSGGTLVLKTGVFVENNTAGLEGGGMFLAAGSTTTLDTVDIGTNQKNKLTSPLGKGVGVYWQNISTLNSSSLTDADDPGGKPVQGN